MAANTQHLEIQENSPVSTRSNCLRKCTSGNTLALQALIGAFLGVLLGVLLLKLEVESSVIEIIEMPGVLFMRAIFLLIAPLLVSSISSGIIESNPNSLKKIGSAMLLYCLSTTLLASLTGVGLHFAISSFRPETIANNSTTATTFASLNIRDTILDITRNIIPNNFVRMFFQASKTEYLNTSEVFGNDTLLTKTIVYTNSANMCGIIFFSVFFGIVVMRLDEKSEPVKKLLLSINYVIMEMLRVVMMTCPFAIVFLIGASIAKNQKNMTVLKGVITTSAANVFGIAFHLTVTLSFVYYIFLRKNPFVFMSGMKHAFITALATSSSAATLPTTIRCMEENNKMDKRLTRVMLPIAATVNMDATCLTITMITLFLAQVNSVPVTFGRTITIVLMASLGSIGTAAVPGTAIFMFVIAACSAASIPAEFAWLFLATDFIVERCRVVLNVYGDCVGVAVLSSLRKSEGEKMKIKDNVI